MEAAKTLCSSYNPNIKEDLKGIDETVLRLILEATDSVKLAMFSKGLGTVSEVSHMNVLNGAYIAMSLFQEMVNKAATKPSDKINPITGKIMNSR